MLKSDSFILRKTSVIIGLIVQIFAVYLFFRGHNQPGGGFIAGVGCSVGILLIIFANGKASTSDLIRFDPVRIAAWGLLISVFSGLISLALASDYLTHYHYKTDSAPFFGSLYLGTPLLFDLGVFMVVVGVILKVSFVLMDALDEQKDEAIAAFDLNRSTADDLLLNPQQPEDSN